MTDTIAALASGRPPAALAVIRLSGPAAFAAVQALAGRIPPPRRLSLCQLHAGDSLLDEALVALHTMQSEITTLEHDIADTNHPDWADRMDRYGELLSRFEHAGGVQGRTAPLRSSRARGRDAVAALFFAGSYGAGAVDLDGYAAAPGRAAC